MLDRWWSETTAVALLGTGRRPPLPLPEELGVVPRVDGSAEEALLDAAALGGTLVRAGATAPVIEAGLPASADAWPEAPDRAVQLLQLLLRQPPVSRELAPAAIGRWLAVAAERGRRVPHAELPVLLDTASRQADLRGAVADVADARGRWLAGANPAWEWLLEASAVPEPDAGDWATLPTPARAEIVARLRASDPGAGRTLVQSTWATEGAKDRLTLLASLTTGLGADDEPLLELALTDRASTVREQARRMLDALPDSARAGRMGDRLRPLLALTGLLRRTLEVALPAEPDADGVRDGLGPPPTHRSARGWWLERLAAGAPLSTWTDATDKGIAATWAMVSDDDARRGILQAVEARRDADWARALAPQLPGLLPLVPAAERESLAVSLLRPGHPVDELRLAAVVPGPWGRELSAAVVARLRARKTAAPDVPLLLLAQGLHPDVLPALQQWDRTDHAWGRLPHHLITWLSFVPAITEAFA